MIITTEIIGEVQIQEEKIVRFEEGIPGFPDEKEFFFYDIKDSNLILMHSLSNNLYFFVVNPFLFFTNYEFDLPESVIEALGIEEPEECGVYCILTIKENFSNTTVNLQAPVIVNIGTKKARQIVLNNPRFSIRQPIFHQPAPIAVPE